MILSVLYMWFAAKGAFEFSPWWLFACTICDIMILGTIGDLIHGTETKLIDINME